MVLLWSRRSGVPRLATISARTPKLVSRSVLVSVRLLFEALALAPIDAALDLDAAGATPQYRTSALRDLARSRSPYAPI